MGKIRTRNCISERGKSLKLSEYSCPKCDQLNSFAVLIDGKPVWEKYRDEEWNLTPVVYSDTRDFANVICVNCGSLKFGSRIWNY